ncbi:hypothetical protein VTK73DRAFT_9895 [Phialemonium thermophilum]|uniref:Zn(2)-C6 fungal-type domain-containing protein n=1 Tax=Phialemonium thermophilum TaxID=223376 RepID=A0ABR3VZL0_9PEZI
MATVSCRAPRLRSRTFTGCHACRSRKVKCDLARPGCANCQRMRLRCPGYGTVLSWMPTWLPDWHDHFGQDACLKQQQQERNLRAELLSGEDLRKALLKTRQMESEKLLNYLNADPAYSDISFLLDDLERKAAQEDVRLTHDIDFQVEVGPYTVFSSRRILSSREDSSCSPRDSSNNNNSSCSSSSSDGLGSQTATLPPISEETAYDEAFSADLLEPYPNLLDAAHLLYDTGLDSDQRRPSMGVASDTSATFPNDIDMMILDMDGRTNSIETQMGDGAPPYGVSGLSLPPGSSSPGAWEHSRDWLQQVTDAGPDDWSPPPPYLDNTTTTTNNNNNLHYNLMCSPPPLTSRFSSGSPYLPPEVRFLLHHYDHHVIDSLSAIPVPRDRAPWRQLHLPCALRAYGELDVLGTSSLARVSLLYSLLSLTCYHLSSLYTSVDLGDVGAAPTPPTQTPNAERWQQRALKFRGIARTAFRKHVASQGTAGGKYKETLMAAMSLICVGVVGGDPWDARLYIRRCEAIIGAATGAKNRFSKRALQLHHIFAFLKIMEETTFCQSQTDYLRFLESSDIPSDEASLVSGRDASRDDLVAWCAGSTKSKGGVVATPRDASSPISVAAPSPPPALQLHILDHNGPLGGLSGVSGKLFEMLIQTNSLIHRIASQADDDIGTTGCSGSWRFLLSLVVLCQRRRAACGPEP